MTNYIDNDEFDHIMDDSIVMTAKSMNEGYKEAAVVFKGRYNTFSRRDKWDHQPVDVGFLGWGDERAQFFPVFLTEAVKVFSPLFKQYMANAPTLKKYTEALLLDNPFVNVFLDAPRAYSDNLYLLHQALHDYNTNTFVAMGKGEKQNLKSAAPEKLYESVLVLKQNIAECYKKTAFSQDAMEAISRNALGHLRDTLENTLRERALGLSENTLENSTVFVNEGAEHDVRRLSGDLVRDDTLRQRQSEAGTGKGARP